MHEEKNSQIDRRSSQTESQNRSRQSSLQKISETDGISVIESGYGSASGSQSGSRPHSRHDSSLVEELCTMQSEFEIPQTLVKNNSDKTQTEKTLDQGQCSAPGDARNTETNENASHVQIQCSASTPLSHPKKVNQAYAYFTTEGGRLTIPNSRVNLYVPPGAIPARKTELIQLKILQSEDTPRLHNKQIWATPTVICGPRGLHFQKDVFLTMPHCATDIDQWEPSVHQNKERGWKRLRDVDETLVIKREKTLIMMMNHFCDQKISIAPRKDTNESETYQTKYMNVAVHLDAKETRRQLSVYLTNNYENGQHNIGLPFDVKMLQNVQNYYCPRSTSLKFISEPRFLELCCVLDDLETASKGWTVVATNLNINMRQCVVRAITDVHSIQSPSSVFLETYFQNQLEANEYTVILEALEALSAACDKADTTQPKEIIDLEILDIRQAKGEWKTKHLSTGVIRICNSGDNVCITCTSQGANTQHTQDEDSAEEDTSKTTEKSVKFEDLWSACDERISSVKDRTTTFNVPDGDFIASIRVVQNGAEDNALQLDINTSDQKYTRQTPSEEECLNGQVIPSPSVTDAAEDLLKLAGVREQLDSKAFQTRAKNLGQSPKDTARELLNAINIGHEPLPTNNETKLRKGTRAVIAYFRRARRVTSNFLNRRHENSGGPITEDVTVNDPNVSHFVENKTSAQEAAIHVADAGESPGAVNAPKQNQVKTNDKGQQCSLRPLISQYVTDEGNLKGAENIALESDYEIQKLTEPNNGAFENNLKIRISKVSTGSYESGYDSRRSSEKIEETGLKFKEISIAEI